MDPVREMLDKLTELSADQLDELETSIIAAFDAIENEDLTRATVETMNELAAGADALRGERTRRTDEAAELSAAREDAIARMRPAADESAEPAAEEDPAVEATEPPAELSDATAAPQEPSEPVEAPTEPASELAAKDVEPASTDPGHDKPLETTKVEVEVTHPASEDLEQEKDTGVILNTDKIDELATAQLESATTPEQESPVTAAAIEIPAGRAPVARERAPITITAGGDIRGVAAGSTLPDMKAVADAIIQRSHAMRKTTGGDGEQQTIATLTASFPEDRYLAATNTAETNLTKISAVTSPEAITAAGGLCAPVEVSYDIFGLEGSTARPVRDALAVFSADRGGIRFVTPPTLADLEGAVSVWTLQDDIDAATAGAPDPIKPCLRVDCGDEVTVYTDAIPLCLTFGNIGARAWPELVERHLELGMVQHARFAEQRLITRIGSLSKSVTAAAQLGAARDFFNQIDVAAAAYRNRYRMDAASPLRVILPEWFKNALRSDLVKQLPGDGQESTFALADNFMANWFSVRHVNVSWHMDGEAGQSFGAQAGNGAALLAFPATLIWYLFSEGTFLFLDGGTLDLGLVRDSVLNGTNDYKVFLETFEGVAKVGIEALRITSQLKIAGASAATVSTI